MQPEPPQPTGSPALKRQKVSPSSSEEVSAHGGPIDEGKDVGDQDGGWKKVERRLAKKQRKVQDKLNVCVSIFDPNI